MARPSLAPRFHSLAVAVLLPLASPAPAQGAEPAREAIVDALHPETVADTVTAPSTGGDLRDWVGTWTTSYGDLTLEWAGEDELRGAYQGGRVEDAHLDGDKLRLRYVESLAQGEAWFVLGEDGRSFTGKWRPEGTEPWYEWTGERAAPLRGPWDGLWDTSYGRMRLVQVGRSADVSGTYALTPGSTVTGQVADDRLTFRYDEGNAKGEGWFALSADGLSFEGLWRQDGTERWIPWTGARVVPEDGVRWLVILEAHWERGLAESEYAFGDMLESYFTMAAARHVRVRHRFFHDLADFERFAGEVRYLAEPVTVLVSSHGSPAGVSVGGETLGAEQVADALRFAGNVDLLHLSGCDMMRGSMPAKIHTALGDTARFPISGYRETVAWDASAISDFVYLSMVLIRGLDPAQAVEQSHLVAPYTGPEKVPGSVFAPMGLTIRPAPSSAAAPAILIDVPAWEFGTGRGSSGSR